MGQSSYAFVQGVRDTRGALVRWNRDPWSVLRGWLTAAAVVTAGLLLAVCSAAVLGQVLRSDPSVHAFFENRTGIMSVLKVALTVIAMLVLTYVVGFYTATLVYVLVYTRFVGKHHWPVAISLSLAISFGSFYLFERVLAILLPRGIYTIIPFFG